MLVGFLEREITPVTEMPLAGSTKADGSPRISSGTSDPLFLKTISINDNNKNIRFLIFSVDLIWVSRDLSDKIRSVISRHFDIETSRIMISATHTHNGPETMTNYYGLELSDEYMTTLLDTFIASAQDVQETVVAASFQVKSISTSANVSRRKRTLDKSALRRGKIRFDYQSSINVYGPRDDVATIVRIKRDTGQNIILLNFAAHPVLSKHSHEFGADWPGALEENWNSTNSSDDKFVFLQGFSGDMLPSEYKLNKIDRFTVGGFIDFLSKPLKLNVSSSREYAVKFAKVLINRLQSSNEVWKDFEISDVFVSSQSVFLDYDVSARPPIKGSSIRSGSVEKYLAHYETVKNEKGCFLEMNAVNLGGVWLLCCDAEMFSSYSRFARSIAQAPIMSVGYCNGMIGYVPDEKAIGEGGYEPIRSLPIFGLPSPFSQSIEKTIKTAIRNLVGSGGK
jgi:hypothetical protein